MSIVINLGVLPMLKASHVIMPRSSRCSAGHLEATINSVPHGIQGPPPAYNSIPALETTHIPKRITQLHHGPHELRWREIVFAKFQRQASPSARGAICRRGPFSLLLSFGQAKESKEHPD